MQTYVPPQPPPPHKRGKKIGKKLKMVEDLWCALPKKERSEKSLIALGKAAGISEEKTKEKFKVALAMLEREGG